MTEVSVPQARRMLDRHFRWRGTEVSRMEAFADAVFALVLALLFLQDVPGNFGELRAAMKAMVPFVVTFALLALVWVEHHRYFRRYGLRDKSTFVANLVLLGLVCVYAYPLKFLFTALTVMALGPIGEITEASIHVGMAPGDGQWIMVFYGGGFGSIFLVMLLLYRHALRRAGELGLDAVERYLTVTSMLECSVYVAVAGASTLIALLDLGPASLAGTIYFAIGPLMGALGWHRGARMQPLVEARSRGAVGGDSAA